MRAMCFSNTFQHACAGIVDPSQPYIAAQIVGNLQCALVALGLNKRTCFWPSQHIHAVCSKHVTLHFTNNFNSDPPLGQMADVFLKSTLMLI
jgi:hypothetical protein